MRKRLGIIILCLALLVTTACQQFNHSDNISKQQEDKIQAVSDTWGEDLLEKAEFCKVADNEYLELYINPKTAEISVKDLGSSVVWYSNPQLSE